MKVLQVTNIISHHQLPFARCMVNHLGDDNYRYVATKSFPVERLKLGWNPEVREPWILFAAENRAHEYQFEQWWDDADVVICGERRLDRIKNRLNNGRLTYYMSERWWKPPIGSARLLHPHFAYMVSKFKKLDESSLFHYLPMGGYAASDIRKIAEFKEKIWQWGYMTDAIGPIDKNNYEDGGFSVLWVGRMLEWKRVDTLIRAFSILLNTRYDAKLTLIGDGPERIRLQRLAKRILPDYSYFFTPPVQANKIMEIMRNAQVYVLPSSGYEGWGAVVNEAMLSNCAVIASIATGAAKSIIKDGMNGLLFNPGDIGTLAKYLELLSLNEDYRYSLAENGKQTINEHWSPSVGAERFLEVSDALLSNRATPIYDKGLMMHL